MKTYELTGVALDWAVAKCEGFTSEYEPDVGDFWIERTNHTYTGLAPFGYLKEALRFSTDWSQGGPIIERERLDLTTLDDEFDKDKWASYSEDGRHAMYGTEPLLAAMRCYVASKLGYTVEVPAELLK